MRVTAVGDALWESQQWGMLCESHSSGGGSVGVTAVGDALWESQQWGMLCESHSSGGCSVGVTSEESSEHHSTAAKDGSIETIAF